MSLAELLSKGGLTMWPIYGCSILALAVFIHRWLGVLGARLRDLSWLDPVLELVHAGEFDQAGAACSGLHHPASRVVHATTTTLAQRPDRAAAEAKRVGNLELARMEKNLPLLSFVAQAAPLLGLLGTVVGMVDLFISLQDHAGQSLAVATLSGGIWKALLTTAAGLSVAVPTLAGYSYLISRVEQLRNQMSDAVDRVLTAASPSQGSEPARDHA